MSYRAYVCNFFKELQLGKNVKFRGGFFETDDPELQAKIESSDGFGVHIHFKDSIEEMERIGKEREEQAAGEKAKKRKEFLAEMATEEKTEAKAEANGKAKAEAAAAKDKKNKRLKAADKVL